MKSINKKILDLSIGSVLMVLLFLAGLNYLATQKYIYLDLTQEKVYTTSEATKNILKNLNKEVKVIFLFPKICRLISRMRKPSLKI